ncbi:MAG: hypothetical protein FJ034_08105 [Chloroflexi bacterium]|nr:hypothetical protein [Chloroflexota bacterium]
MTESEERAYVAGSASVYREMLGVALRGLHREPLPDTLEAAQERIAKMEVREADVRATLRRLCATYGDNDWTDSLHLSDVIEKHLVAHWPEEDE